jgi:hypothetical protein
VGKLFLQVGTVMCCSFPSLRSILLGALASLFIAGAAAAVPISMDPGAVMVSTVFGFGNDFTLVLDSGDTADNRLQFSIAGGGGWGDMDDMPSVGLAAMIFDDLSVLSAGEISDPDDVIRGITLPEMGGVAALLIDRSSPSSASFFVETSVTPTTATIYSLSLAGTDGVRCAGDIVDHIVDSERVRFDSPGSPIPEPTAALVFAVGFLVTQAGRRR